MASSTISSLGIGSGLDANSIVSKLMALEEQPLTILNAKNSSYNAKLSAFGQLKSALSTLQTAAKTLADPNKLAAFTATAADDTILSGSASSFASPGSYNVEVVSLATAQKRYTATAYGSSASFGSGTLTFNVAGVDKTVNITAGASLNDVRAAINAANIGVTASVISGDGGSRLVLTGATAGSAGSFSLAVTSADSNLQSLSSFNLANPFSTNAQDAVIKVDGETLTSSTNTISTAINGVTLTLEKVGTTQLDVAKDSSKVSEAVNTFVTAYNAAVSMIKTNSAYDAATKTSKPLNAESTVRSISQILGQSRTSIPTALVGAKYETLSALGISVGSDGTLSVNSSKLSEAVSGSFTDVQQTLNAYGQAFSDNIEKLVGTSGLIASRVEGLNRSIKLIDADKERLQTRLDMIEKRYRAQFTALDTLVSGLQTTGTYLTQQLAALNNS